MYSSIYNFKMLVNFYSLSRMNKKLSKYIYSSIYNFKMLVNFYSFNKVIICILAYIILKC
jgi:hypothetical protein